MKLGVRERPAVEGHGYTHRGIRHDNQDSILVQSPWFAVADGVGGHAGGADASGTAIAAVGAFALNGSTTDVVEAAAQAHAAVQQLAGESAGTDRPATTLTVAVVAESHGRHRFEIAHVGDSRAYVISKGRIEQVTADHTFVHELRVAGRLNPEQALAHPMRHVVTRVCGQSEPLQIDHVTVPAAPGDFLLLVSDGLADLSEQDILFIVDNSCYVKEAASPVEWAARALVDHARGRGSRDNTSAVLARIA